MSDLRDRALETLREVSNGLLEDTVAGHPTKNIHTHLYAAMRAVTDLLQHETKEDPPSQADPRYPGGKHRRSEEEVPDPMEFIIQKHLDDYHQDIAPKEEMTVSHRLRALADAISIELIAIAEALE